MPVGEPAIYRRALRSERALRPPEKRHQPWVQRITGQLLAAYAELEAVIKAKPIEMSGGSVAQAGITAAVAWRFTQSVLSDHVPAADHPTLVAQSNAAEALPQFRAAPHGEGTISSDA